MKLKDIRLFKKVLIIAFILASISLLICLGYFTYKSIVFSPKKIRITNITENSATISWITDTPSKGVVYYKEEESFLPGPLIFIGAENAYDDRDYHNAQLRRVNNVNEKNLKDKDVEYIVDTENVNYGDFRVTKLGNYYTHHVTIRGLDPVSEYYFRVSDNWFSWDIGGVDQSREITEIYDAEEFNFTTFERLNSIPSPNPAYGKVVGVYRDEEGIIHDDLNQDTIVYGFLFDEETLDQTTMYSSITNEEGGWVIDKSTMRMEEGSISSDFKEGEDFLVLYPQYMNARESFSVGLILEEEDSPSPNLIGGEQELSSISLDQKIFGFVKPLYAYQPKEAEETWSTTPKTFRDFHNADRANLKKDVISGALVSIKKSDGTTSYSGNLSLYDDSSPGVKDSVKATIKKHVEEEKGVISNIDAVINFKPKNSNSTSTQARSEEDTTFLQDIKAISEINATDLLIKNLQDDDSRNTSVKCEDLKINGNSVSSSDYWAYNCYTDTANKPQSCTTSAVAAGCGTSSACYEGSGDDRKKCAGCARPSSCANVWSRPSDVVVDGLLYTKSDILNVVLGNTDRNSLLEGLSRSISGKTICTNQAGDKIMAIVDPLKGGSCPQYSSPSIQGFQADSFLGNTDSCRSFLSNLDNNIDTGVYCKDTVAGSDNDGDGVNVGLISNAVSQNSNNPYNCSDLRCDTGYEVMYRKNSTTECFCGSTRYAPSWERYDGSIICDEDEEIKLYLGIKGAEYCVPLHDNEKEGGSIVPLVDSVEYVERKKYRIEVSNEGLIFKRDVIYVLREIRDIGGSVSTVGGSTTTKYLDAWMTDEEYNNLMSCNADCSIKDGSILEIESLDETKYYDVSTDEEIQVYSKEGQKFLALDNAEFNVLASNQGTTTALLLKNLQQQLDSGYINISDEDAKGISTISVDMERYWGYRDSLSQLDNANNIKNGGFDIGVIHPEEPGEYEVRLMSICPQKANDYEHCLTTYGQDEDKVFSDLGIEDYKDEYSVIVDNTTTKEIIYCPKGRNCTTTYTVTYQDKNGDSHTDILELPYSTDSGVKRVKLGTNTYDFIPDEDKVNFNGDPKDFSDIEENSWFEDSLEEIKEEFSSLYNKVLGVFSPVNVQAQGSDKYIDGSNDKGLYEIVTSSGKKVYYVDTTDQKYIIFYEEGNGELGFQEPEDINNPKEDEDVLVFVNKDSVKKISQAYSYWIEQGINLVSFPFLPVNQERKAMMASDLMTSNNTVSQKIARITYFENGKWYGGIKASEDNKYVGNDFPLVPGKGYLIIGEYGTNISIPGFPLSEPFPIEISAGWNLIGVHGYAEIYTAEELIDGLDGLEGIDADNVTWWPRNLGRYEGLQKTGDTKYGFDFPLSNKLGYFVRIDSYTNKCPSSVLWNPGEESHGLCGSD